MTGSAEGDVRSASYFIYADNGYEGRRLEFRIAALPGEVRLSFGPAFEDHEHGYTLPAASATMAGGWLADDVRRVARHAVKLGAAPT